MTPPARTRARRRPLSRQFANTSTTSLTAAFTTTTDTYHNVYNLACFSPSLAYRPSSCKIYAPMRPSTSSCKKYALRRPPPPPSRLRSRAGAPATSFKHHTRACPPPPPPSASCTRQLASFAPDAIRANSLPSSFLLPQAPRQLASSSSFFLQAPRHRVSASSFKTCAPIRSPRFFCKFMR